MEEVRTPCCSIALPTNMMLPVGLSTIPLLRTIPELESTSPTQTSKPRRLGSVCACDSMPTWRPAARMVWPAGVEIWPSLRTLAPTSMTRPPLPSALVGVCRSAPRSTTTSPYFAPVGRGVGMKAGVPSDPPGTSRPEKRNWASLLLRRPFLMRLSLIGRAEATRVRALTWEPAPKMMPFWLMM